MIDTVALLLIRAYRAWLSPLKGYRCAWGAASGRDTCSGVGLRVFRRAGWRRGLMLMRRQFDRCAIAADELKAVGTYRRLRPIASQRGDCDCGGCDFDFGWCDTAECLADAPCDCGGRRETAAEAARKRRDLRREKRASRAASAGWIDPP